jgi:hypothetical protein
LKKATHKKKKKKEKEKRCKEEDLCQRGWDEFFLGDWGPMSQHTLGVATLDQSEAN